MTLRVFSRLRVFEGRFLVFVVCLAHPFELVFGPPFFPLPQLPSHSVFQPHLLCCRYHRFLRFFIRHSSVRGTTGASFLAPFMCIYPPLFSSLLSFPPVYVARSCWLDAKRA